MQDRIKLFFSFNLLVLVVLIAVYAAACIVMWQIIPIPSIPIRAVVTAEAIILLFTLAAY